VSWTCSRSSTATSAWSAGRSPPASHDGRVGLSGRGQGLGCDRDVSPISHRQKGNRAGEQRREARWRRRRPASPDPCSGSSVASPAGPARACQRPPLSAHRRRTSGRDRRRSRRPARCRDARASAARSGSPATQVIARCSEPKTPFPISRYETCPSRSCKRLLQSTREHHSLLLGALMGSRRRRDRSSPCQSPEEIPISRASRWSVAAVLPRPCQADPDVRDRRTRTAAG
jgi:hypothetical protein